MILGRSVHGYGFGGVRVLLSLYSTTPPPPQLQNPLNPNPNRISAPGSHDPNSGACEAPQSKTLEVAPGFRFIGFEAVSASGRARGLNFFRAFSDWV